MLEILRFCHLQISSKMLQFKFVTFVKHYNKYYILYAKGKI